MAENPKLPLVVRSFRGHLALQGKNQPDRPLTTHQVTTFNWLLEQAKIGFPHQRVQALRPIADGEELTVTDLRGRVETLAEAMKL